MQDGSRSDTPLVLLDAVEPGIAVLTLNRPEARNALSRALIKDFHALIERLSQDRAVAAIIVAASGSVFSSGHDLKELTSHRSDPDGGRGLLSRDDAGVLGSDARPCCFSKAHYRSCSGTGDGRRLPACRDVRPGGCLRYG